MYLNLRVERRRQCDERTLLWDVRVEKTTNPMFLVLAPHSGSFVTLIAWHRVPWIPSSLTIESVINETATNGLARKVTREKRLSARNAFLMSPLMQLLHYHDYNKILNGSFFMWNYVFFLFFIVRPWRFIVALVRPALYDACAVMQIRFECNTRFTFRVSGISRSDDDDDSPSHGKWTQFRSCVIR